MLLKKWWKILTRKKTRKNKYTSAGLVSRYLQEAGVVVDTDITPDKLWKKLKHREVNYEVKKKVSASKKPKDRLVH